MAPVHCIRWLHSLYVVSTTEGVSPLTKDSLAQRKGTIEAAVVQEKDWDTR